MKRFILLLILITTITNTTPTIEMAAEYHKNEQFTDAIRCYEEITQQDPSNISALFSLGNCYLAVGLTDQAITAFKTIATVCPDAVAARHNLGYTYKTVGKTDEAIETYQEIIRTHPDYEPAQLSLGFTYIAAGNFEQGWKQHERHLKRIGRNGDALRHLLTTNTIAGKTIVLKPEGDLGDTLLFIRYAQRLHDMGARVIAVVQKPLIPLLSSCAYIDELVTVNSSVPAYDADITLMSLPAVFNDQKGTFPNNVPYLFPDPASVQLWKERLAHDTNYKIGICWQVNKKNDESRLPIARRGCPLNEFHQLSKIPGVSLYSLQKYDGLEELATVPSDFSLHLFDNLDEQTGAFMDTAAIMKNLDLIITVDTAITHLAGALGCKTWLLLPLSTDWRWITDRTDSYWYPTITIFKQQEPFNWTKVIHNIENELRTIIAQR
jgi:tetratricopeptide (TPR) repeat protein